MKSRPSSVYLLDMIKNTPASELNFGGSTPPFTQPADFFADVKPQIIGGAMLTETSQLQSLMADHLNCDNDEIKFAAGSSQVYTQALAAITVPGDDVYIEHPTYEPFVASAQFLNLKVSFFKRTASADTDIQQLKKTLKSRKKKPKVIVLSNTHCPTGQIYNKATLLEFAKLADYLIIDEVFLPLFAGGQMSLLIGDRPKNIITIGSFSKSLGLSSLRLGWLRANRKVTLAFEKLAYNFYIELPTMSVLYGLKALQNWQKLMQPNLECANANRSLWQKFSLDSPGLLSHNFANGYFAVLKVPKKFKTGEAFSKDVLKSGIYVRPTRLFYLPDHVRFHILITQQQNEKLFETIKSYF